MSFARALVALLLLLLGCSTSQGPETTWYRNGQPAADTSWSRSDPPFGAVLMVIDSASAPDLYDRWENVPGGVPVKRIESAPVGTRIETIIIFVHCEPDPSGNCLVEGRGSVRTSNGRVLVADAQMILSAKPAPIGNSLGISESGLGLEVAAGEDAYEFQIEVLDRIGGRSVSLSQTIEVLE